MSAPLPARIFAAAALAVAVYLLAYFPAVSYMARHPKERGYSAIWRPLLGPVRSGLLRVWSKVDPDGFAMVEDLARSGSR